jgi:hypothetical protein
MTDEMLKIRRILRNISDLSPEGSPVPASATRQERIVDHTDYTRVNKY